VKCSLHHQFTDIDEGIIIGQYPTITSYIRTQQNCQDPLHRGRMAAPTGQGSIHPLQKLIHCDASFFEVKQSGTS
jgi:hypothetical protein